MSSTIKSFILFTILTFSLGGFALTQLEIADRALLDIVNLEKDGKIPVGFIQDSGDTILILTEYGKVRNEFHILARGNMLVASIDPATGEIQSFKLKTYTYSGKEPALRGIAVFQKMSAYIKEHAALGEKEFINMNEKFREYMIGEGSGGPVGFFSDTYCMSTLIFRMDSSGNIISTKPGHCG